MGAISSLPTAGAPAAGTPSNNHKSAAGSVASSTPRHAAKAKAVAAPPAAAQLVNTTVLAAAEFASWRVERVGAALNRAEAVLLHDWAAQVTHGGHTETITTGGTLTREALFTQRLRHLTRMQFYEVQLRSKPSPV